MQANREKLQLIGRGRRLASLGCVALMAWTTACTSLLAVDAPGLVQSTALNDPAMAPILVSTALGEFECGFNQWVPTVGILTGEYWDSDAIVDGNTWGALSFQVNTMPGTCSNGLQATGFGFYQPFQTARYTIENAQTIIGGFTATQVPARAEDLAQLQAYDAYTYLLLGEGMCSMTINDGPMITRGQTFAIADSGFSKALTLAAAAGDADLTNMSYVGRARTRLDEGNPAGALADAVQVPKGYLHVSEYSLSRVTRYNRMYLMTFTNLFMSVAPAYQGLTVNGSPDPRVPVKNLGILGPDNLTTVWQQQKYLVSSAVPLPLASWKEAELIIAETSTGQAQIDAINAARSAQNVAAIVIPPGANMDSVVVEERRRAMFSEGTRLEDMLRKKIPFPTGQNHKLAIYGPTSCVPIPLVESQNNPNLQNITIPTTPQ
jgi:hypothetical protein